jgi:hypothetical protein
MNECPYCYSAVGPNDAVCPKCGREIERWQTGFYTRQPLPGKKKTVVRVALITAVLVVLGGFARACHLI